MHTSQIEVLLKSLCKQLQCTEEALNPKVISLIQESKLYTYGDVKILSLKLKPFLSKNEHPIKYSQVINMLSKALGYENQHSFVALRAHCTTLNSHFIEFSEHSKNEF